MRLLIAITGASGFPLAVRFLQKLGELKIERHLVVSQNAQKVREYESSLSEADMQKLCEHQYPPEQIHTRICSGSFDIDGMVVIPCSMNTLGHIANGIEHNAITRAAAVNLKMRRPVVLVPRDTPLTIAHLRNMLRAAEIGCDIIPPVLCYYTKAQSIADLENYIIGRIFEILRIKAKTYPKWDVK